MPSWSRPKSKYGLTFGTSKAHPIEGTLGVIANRPLQKESLGIVAVIWKSVQNILVGIYISDLRTA